MFTFNCLLWCSLIRAYGAVYKAVHKESGQLLAIKQVPVDSDLQDIIKEISIMQQCDRYSEKGREVCEEYNHSCCQGQLL